jgi:sialate O-acetylesterase
VARDGRVMLEFDHLGGGLVALDSVPSAGRVVGEERLAELRGFAVAGADGRFVRADARIDGDRVVVWSVEVPEPVAVRYAWADNPEGANLYNLAGLPASPFRTDTW